MYLYYQLLPSSTELYPELDMLSSVKPTNLPLIIPSRDVIDPPDFSGDDISDKNPKPRKKKGTAKRREQPRTPPKLKSELANR
ncbi:unnamed protein product [Didymodactylos carnosus]|uniref:Uncharacterized protein n=1 Tax=Didymodactylos carnosus TaxID=1234261 RepID=A0A815E3Z8_9BILA|nr:unnamed protein product [Didymodactylos carnosus]CAF4146168.1 unnamed protein product [Didymodactylos carnosus]